MLSLDKLIFKLGLLLTLAGCQHKRGKTKSELKKQVFDLQESVLILEERIESLEEEAEEFYIHDCETDR